MLWDIILTIIFGAVIGVLARLVLPGKQQYGMIVTVRFGRGRSFDRILGLGGLLGKGDTARIDVIRWIISIAAAAVLSLGYSAITGKK